MALVDRERHVAAILDKVDLCRPEQIPPLAELPMLEPLLPAHHAEARSLLIKQRISEPGYKSPETRLRHKFSTTRLREKRTNREEWIFSKHEVAKALHSLLSQTPLPQLEIARAVLSHSSDTSLDELWCHLHDPNLEKRMTSRFRRSRCSLLTEPTWLDDMVAQDNLPYLHLLCQAGFEQEVLDRAFTVALSKELLNSMEMLLRFGATASRNQVAIRERIQADDVPLARILLAAPKAMSVEAWRYSMEPQVEGQPTILAMCLAHRPDIVCAQLLLKALESQNLQATAVIFAYQGPSTDLQDHREAACTLATKIAVLETRHKFFDLLSGSDLLVDCGSLRAELMKDVKLRFLPLVRILTDAGVSLDVEPDNALHWAMSKMELDTLETFRNGTVSNPVAQALECVPDSVSETDMIRLLDIFASRNLSGVALHSQLVRAVRKEHQLLARKLIHCGASVEFEQVCAIRTAIDKANFHILEVLLEGESSPVALSAAIPSAMAVQSRLDRRKAMKAIMDKGVSAHELGMPLQSLVSEKGAVDLDLIQLLLQHGAPVDGIGEEPNGCVLVAARRGNLSVLSILCKAKPRKPTLSKAVAVAFGTIQERGHETAMSMIKLLLSHGAAGIPVHSTLLMAVRDNELSIVRLLIDHGADANYEGGTAFSVALKAPSPDLLRILCVRCPPNRASTEAALPVATDPRYYSMQTLGLLLEFSSSSAAVLNSWWSAEKFRNRHDIGEITLCFLRHGLDVNLRNGTLLCFAIDQENISLLHKMLVSNPNTNALAAAFQAASTVQTRSVRLLAMNSLLEKAASAQIGQTKALLQETTRALSGDLTGLQLLLRHGADVNADEGRAIQVAAKAGALDILNALLAARPAKPSLHKACLAAAASGTSEKQKTPILTHLLDSYYSLSPKDFPQLLADSVVNLPDCTHLPKLLLQRQIKPKLDTLKVAIGTSSKDLLKLLLSSINNADLDETLFKYAKKLELDLDRKYWVLDQLLAHGHNISGDEVSDALLTSLKTDDFGNLRTTKLLIERGANVRYQDGKAFVLALMANSVEAVKLLSQNINSNATAEVAFRHARQAALQQSSKRAEVYRCLLQWDISKSLLQETLVAHLKSGQSNDSIVQLLIAKGADPNDNNAQCFILAAKAGHKAHFRALSQYAKLEVVLPALLTHFEQERTIVGWLNMCLWQRPFTGKLDQAGLALRCLRLFPQGHSLLKTLIENGTSLSETVNHSLGSGWAAERCSILIWALFSSSRVGNHAILTLINQGGGAAHPTYVTPVTKVSAALGCLLDKTRTPVLEALLRMNRSAILAYKISESTLCKLGAASRTLESETHVSMDNDGLTLHQASLYLGNLGAFKATNHGHLPNDGSLHQAALLALPKFVKWLLETHDPNLQEEEYDNLIPLAVVCSARWMPSCKIANEEADLRIRQKETMHLLATKTDLSWRHNGKTVLHFAIENGVETTKAMIQAIGFGTSANKGKKYVYSDKAGKQYLPQEYVKEFTNMNETEKVALVMLLNKYDGEEVL